MLKTSETERVVCEVHSGHYEFPATEAVWINWCSGPAEPSGTVVIQPAVTARDDADAFACCPACFAEQFRTLATPTA